LLGCIDTLTGTLELSTLALTECTTVPPTKGPLLGRTLTTPNAPPRSKVYSSEDFSAVNRFESYGGGWGYSGHSIEAIRFMSDTDLLVGGFGLFGGRGEYTGKIKLYDIGMDGGEQESDGDLLAETEELPYECAPRQKYAMLFDEPVAIQQYRWYVAWARIGGPSSDCGSSGQGTVSTEDQVFSYFFPQITYVLTTFSNLRSYFASNPHVEQTTAPT
jgi:PHR domain